ncbi:MAG: hypothetical protein EPN84_12180 [Legionella sp.]|nr:MAG: hypothetical protein EPN84_12180 [Legionella sp.]
MQRTLRGRVFYPPFILLLTGTVVSVVYQDSFLKIAGYWHQKLLMTLGATYSVVAFLMVLTCFFVFVSPLGKVRIGGENCPPELTRWQWFTISLCSTVACGLLFWGTAEPLFHYFQPPATQPQGDKVFALANLILDWTFTPYAIYTVPALIFALNFHNFRAELSFASCLHPLFSLQTTKKLNGWVDCICLYSLAIGMSSSLAAGILILWGGLNQLFLLPKNLMTLGAITALIVFTFVGAAASGVLKGIRVLADWNVKLFAVIILYVAFQVDVGQILILSGQSLIYYVQHFLELSLWTHSHPQDAWGYQWGAFYWASWMSWAPITALFLGKIAKGYTVREFIVMNFFVPSLFSLIWMSLFGGLALTSEPLQTLYQIILKQGPESVIYFLMGKMPWATGLIGIFLLTCFLSFVTAADANTVAMADISSAAPEGSREKKYLKIIWGMVLGCLSLVAVLAAGIDGIRMLANFSGIPALFLLTWVLLSLLKLNLLSMRTWNRTVLQQRLIHSEE